MKLKWQGGMGESAYGAFCEQCSPPPFVSNPEFFYYYTIIYYTVYFTIILFTPHLLAYLLIVFIVCLF